MASRPSSDSGASTRYAFAGLDLADQRLDFFREVEHADHPFIYECKKAAIATAALVFLSGKRLFPAGIVGNGQFLAAFGAACGEHFAAVGGRHSLTETVLIDLLSL